MRNGAAERPGHALTGVRGAAVSDAAVSDAAVSMVSAQARSRTRDRPARAGRPTAGHAVHRWGVAARTRSRSSATARPGSSARVHRRAGDEAVDARLGGGLDGVVVDAAVDLDEQPAGARCRPAAARSRTLSSTSGMNSWPPNPGSTLITSSVSKWRSVSRWGSSGVPGLTDSPARAPAARRSRARATGSRRRLDVHRHVVRARLGVADRPPVRVVDHEVAVERDVGRRQQRLDHRQAEGEVRHEVGVHHVDVQPVGAGRRARRRRSAASSAEPGEVGGQDARGDHRMHVARVRRAGAAVRRRGCRSGSAGAAQQGRGTSRRCRGGAATAARVGPVAEIRHARAAAAGRRAARTFAGRLRSDASRRTTPTVSARCGEQVT